MHGRVQKSCRVYYYIQSTLYTEYILSEYFPPSGGRRRLKMHNKDCKEWIRLPIGAVKDDDLTLSDALVLAVILDYIDGESKSMSIDKIIQKTGLSNYQVRQSIKALVKAEYLTAESRAGKKTIFTQCDVLPPKRQSQKKQSQSQSSGQLDLEKYKIFINADLEEEYK